MQRELRGKLGVGEVEHEAQPGLAEALAGVARHDVRKTAVKLVQRRGLDWRGRAARLGAGRAAGPTRVRAKVAALVLLAAPAGAGVVAADVAATTDRG